MLGHLHAYPDDIVLLCPTPSAMRKLLSICDTYANEYDIKFNAQKSKLLVVSPSNRHRQATGQTCYCPFFIVGNQL